MLFATRHCVAIALKQHILLRCFLLHCITLYFRFKVTRVLFLSLHEGHLSNLHLISWRSRYFHPLWTRRLPKIKKTKKFFLLLLLISCHKNISVFQYQYSSLSTVTLPYPNLTWLSSSFGVKLDNGVVPHAPRSPPRLTVFNRHPLFHNPVTCV